MRLRTGLGVCAAAIALGATAPAADAADFLAGAAKQVTSPPLAGTPAGNAADAAFAPQFATVCAGFPDRGRFALQEPFVDMPDKDGKKNGQWDAHVDLTGDPPSGPPEPYCDANGNGHWDGIYQDNQKGPATAPHDDLEVRAVAVSDGKNPPVVYASVGQIGIFDFYTEDARTRLRNTYHVNADLVVSANHNESSPDSIGLYGALNTPLGVGVRSGIDEYFMDYLDDKIAHAAADAVKSMKPATLFANQVQGAIPDGTSGKHYPLLTNMSERISDQFPTSVANPTYAPNDNRAAAVDPKMGVLQARGANGQTIFTVMSLAAHNQEMGNSGTALSGDWPGAFQRAFDASHPGVAMFLVGDNGSMEDPQTEPPVITDGSENQSSTETQFMQAKATGERFATIAAGAASNATRLSPGPVKLTRRAICIPLENDGFLALAAGGEFGRRQAWACDPSGNPVQPIPNGFVAPTTGAQFRSFLSYADIGPDLQLIDNPGEAFPALMLGSPFGVEEQSCPRPNPAVPTWHARALYRFHVGLADDLIGYLIPAWGFASGVPGLFNNDTCFNDMNGHGHKLESESIGPTGSNQVANDLATMLDAQKDPSAHVVQGRFVLADGSYSRWPTRAAAILIPTGGSTSLDPGGGKLIGAPTTSGFGNRAVDASGVFMDYDGQPQRSPDITTRGMMVIDPSGCVSARYYLNVFPALDTSHKLGAVTTQPAVKPTGNCSGGGTSPTPGLQPGSASHAGLPPPPGAPGHKPCRDRTLPRSAVEGRHSRFSKNRLILRGTASDSGCGKQSHVARVIVSVGRKVSRGHCRFIGTNGRLGPVVSCLRPTTLLLAHGRGNWSIRLRVSVPRGRYVVKSLAIDTAGNWQRVTTHGPNVVKLTR